jgi:diguanylate cyclase (GGDEF)-like protein/PAS domain S-box-containing protein
VLDNVVDPGNFLQKVQYLYEHQQETSRDEIALRDGKIFDRYSAPMFGLDGKYYGRVWYFRDITDRKRVEAEREKLLQDLGERVKELKCVNDISRLAEKPWVSIEEFVQGAVNILPPAWQYPEICCARIMLDSKEFKTANFRETEWSQSANIIVDRKKFGAVTICYLEEKPAADEGPFLKEGRSLINTVADLLGHIIQHRLSEAEVMASEEKFRMIFDNANDGILLADTESKKVHFANVTICRMLGYSQEEIKNMGVMDIHPKKDIPYVIEQFQKQSRKEITVAQDLPVKRKDGSVFYADVNSAPVEISGKQYLLGIFRDSTERKQAEEELRYSEERYRSVVENIGIGIALISPNMEILSLNKQMKTWFPQIDVSSRPICYSSFNEPPREEICSYCPTCKTLQDGQVHEAMTETPAKDKVIFFRVVSSPVKDQDGKIIAAIEMVEDVTERKRMEDRLQYLAYYDALTGLPNRNLFLDRVNQAIARAEPTSRVVAVLITNIDRFKSINDTYGSEIGDRVLKEIAGRLSTSVRKGDTIARLSNDEFGIALLDVAHPDDIVMVLEKIIKDISYPLKVEEDELTLTFSTGVSLYPNDGNSASELLKAAGLALGTAKKDRMKPYQFFTEDLNIKASELILMEKGLLKAITSEEFILHYQPYWDITTKKMVGMEALIRWQSKDKGLVPPGKFIPILEDTGMIIEVGEWILRKTIREVKEWQNNGYPVVPVSVNLSLIQFRQKDLAEMVNRIIRESGFYPSLLTLEITESAFMQDIEFTNSVLRKLKDIGVSISIDDFGTGYSSLAYLKRLPVDNLKIDISFIREVVQDPDSASIVMAIINMAHTLNLKTIAEGIETEEQWKFLRLLRCDMGQGFYLSKPLPPEEMATLIISQG